MLRRLHPTQPDSFAFTGGNRAWADTQIAKYPAGRQASAIIPLLWRAQEQEGWLSRPAIEHVADMLGLAYIRALEVATFYFMFHLQPVGSVAHVQVCGTLSCMLMGAEDLVAVCEHKIAHHHHVLSDDGRFSWEEVECLGSCANAPMAQIGKDYYEDLTPERLGWIIDEMAAGRVPVPGPQNGRYGAEPLKGLTSLTAHENGRMAQNASVELAIAMADTIKRIDGSEVASFAVMAKAEPVAVPKGRSVEPQPGSNRPIDQTGITIQQAATLVDGKPEPTDLRAEAATAVPLETVTVAETAGESMQAPATLAGPRDGKGDDLKRIVGVGPKLEGLLHGLGIWHFDQIAAWTPAQVAWVDSHLGTFRGRITRDDWIAQARAFLAG